MKVSLVKVVASVLLTLAVGMIGSIVTIPSIGSWYIGLTKPFFTPPNWLFGPAWTSLYICMGISFGIVWSVQKKKKQWKEARNMYIGQLALNVLWSFLFFGFHSPVLAFLEVVVLWLAIFYTIRKFSVLSVQASWFLYPYLAWVSFASLLNLSIIFLN
jgi:translocator protein